MDAVKLRENYQQALLLLSNLQQHPATHQRALSKLFLLVRLCYSIQKTAVSLHDKDSSSIWQQRAATLHSDLTTATAQFLQSADQSGEQFWDGCLRLLYVGAEAYEQIESEKGLLVAQLSGEKEQCARLEQTLQNERQKIELGVKESMELRSKIVIQQQIIEPLEKNYREAHHRLDATIKEKHALSAEKERLSEERAQNLQILERQAGTIQQLMEQCESTAKEKNEALESLKSINEDNHTLRVNLGQHGQVIENLININAEMMDAANYYALQLEQKKLLEQEQAKTQSSLVDVDQHEETGGRSLDEPHLQNKTTVSSQIEGDQASPGSSPTKTVSGPAPDFFSRIKGKNLSSDALHTLSTAEQPHPLKPKFEPGQNGEEASNMGEPTRKNVGWTSDMLISKRGSASLDNLRGLEEKVIHSNGSASLENLKDLEERASKVQSSSPSLFGKLGGMGGRLQVVGGKAKGFLNFVAGADLASSEST